MIFEENSGIKLDGQLLPGVLKSIEVEGEALIDAATVEGSKKKPKQSIGYDDKKVYVELILADGPGAKTAKDKLETLEKLYCATGQAKPKAMTIVNEHTARRGISKILWKSLVTKESNKDDLITASLEFWEDTVMTLTATKAGGSTQTGQTAGISSEYQDYLTTRGVGRRKSVASVTAYSPVAADPQPNPFLYRELLAKLEGKK
ncbi:MAG: transcriptional regulator [Peptococcaceae bacterium]|nr:transcriptional regulator [Peptococcaceae bacterium]